MSLASSASLFNIFQLELRNSNIFNLAFSNLSLSTYLIFSSTLIQVIMSVTQIVVIVKISDPTIMKIWKKYPIVLGTLFLVSLFEPLIIHIIITNLLGAKFFSVKF